MYDGIGRTYLQFKEKSGVSKSGPCHESYAVLSYFPHWIEEILGSGTILSMFVSFTTIDIFCGQEQSFFFLFLKAHFTEAAILYPDAEFSVFLNG